LNFREEGIRKNLPYVNFPEEGLIGADRAGEAVDAARARTTRFM